MKDKKHNNSNTDKSKKKRLFYLIIYTVIYLSVTLPFFIIYFTGIKDLTATILIILLAFGVIFFYFMHSVVKVFFNIVFLLFPIIIGGLAFNTIFPGSVGTNFFLILFILPFAIVSLLTYHWGGEHIWVIYISGLVAWAIFFLMNSFFSNTKLIFYCLYLFFVWVLFGVNYFLSVNHKEYLD